MKFYRNLLLAVLAAPLSSCVTTQLETIAPVPPSAAPQLLRGRQIYLVNCTKCHSAEPVHRYTRAQWDKIMPDMVEETNLNAADGAAVTAYVNALVAR